MTPETILDQWHTAPLFSQERIIADYITALEKTIDECAAKLLKISYQETPDATDIELVSDALNEALQ
jgi:uncharacterized protein YqgV (UPF0045/DUF77 family)